MNYQQTLDFLYSQLPVFHRVGAVAYKADLTNTIELCGILGNPQKDFKSIHIAGTNGKGSVSHMLASILQESGYKTGLYTSPHLKDYRERIRVNGEMIPKVNVSRFVKKYREEIEEIRPSFFEMSVAMAFDYFRNEKVEIAVIETGLGGRLDSTNIILPLLSIITNISFDHMQFLGNTLDKIAAEKAGIIKPGIPVVIGETQKETKKVFIEQCKKSGSQILFADKLFSTLRTSEIIPDQHFLFADVLRSGKPFLKDLISPLAGSYQLKNITTVMGACEMMTLAGIQPGKGQIRNGIEHVILNTGLSGRWQVLSRSPLTICDTGHNEAGLKEVLEQISKTPFTNLHFVFGVVNDKDIRTILKMLPKRATYYFCKADIPRALDAGELKYAAEKAGLTGNAYPSVKSALITAQRNAEKDDLVFVGGSTFVVAEVV